MIATAWSTAAAAANAAPIAFRQLCFFSAATMVTSSGEGALYGLVNLSGNFGVVDQSQKAAAPKAAAADAMFNIRCMSSPRRNLTQRSTIVESVPAYESGGLAICAAPPR